MTTPLLIRVWGFRKETKMAHPAWDTRLASTGPKVFRAEAP
jgi:hypothetical protein